MTGGVLIGVLLCLVCVVLCWLWTRRAEVAAKRSKEQADRITEELAGVNDRMERGR